MWYAIIETETGRLHSVGTVLAEETPSQYTVQELGEDFVQAGKEWDTENRMFVTDRFNQRIIDSILAIPGMQRLTAGERTGVSEKLEGIFRGELLP